MRSEILPIVMMVAGVVPATAQRITPLIPQAEYVVRLRLTPQAPPLVVAQDHALEGAKIGGLVFGLGTIGLAYSWCAQGDGGHATTFGYCAPRALLGGLMGATLGAVIGGFIGSTIPKSPAESAPQP